MAIQVRRGLKKDFDPYKMLPGEWAVSIDAQTQNQIVWMCFAAGVVKRMGTYEDFYVQIKEIEEEIANYFFEAYKQFANELKEQTEQYIQGKVDNEWIPALEVFAERAESAADAAEESKKAAKESENNTKEYQESAAGSATTAAQKATLAGKSAEEAAGSASEAVRSAGTSAEKAQEASHWADLAESFTHGGTGARDGEDTDNAEYYYEQAKHISQGGNGLVPMGTITFAQLPTYEITTNAMYNISNDFTSDSRFVDGGGKLYGEGSNVYYTVEGLWDVLAASNVTGVKGNDENSYRQGNVNITSANVGAVAIGGDTAKNTVTFSSDDDENPTEWTDVELLKSGEKHRSILEKISTMFKNVRYLWKMLGNTDISAIGDGTVTGALDVLNGNSIIESGSKENGSYIRYANGIQICWMYKIVKNQTIQNAYGNLFFGYYTWAFPVPFIDNNVGVACGMARHASNASWGTVNGISSGAAAIYILDVASRGAGDCQISMIAIGKWK